MTIKELKEERKKLIERLRLTKKLSQQREIKIQIDWLEEKMCDTNL